MVENTAVKRELVTPRVMFFFLVVLKQEQHYACLFFFSLY